MEKKLLEYFKGDELAANVWLSKYAYKDEDTPDDMHKRMAKEFAKVEEDYKYTSKSHFYKTKHHKLSKYGQVRQDLKEGKIYQLYQWVKMGRSKKVSSRGRKVVVRAGRVSRVSRLCFFG